ncbi:response regulator transcription factor [Seohaeicola sp. SP36]|uniref:response regulator transcription factor n=1 Tax=unclassified Seohaeicola TaxID=2641111 RepID=UPI00237ABFEE|nr:MULTISPECIES: response regulator transcription factor [unclassified Seohaeicola]MDD9707310.1 response regulator transcription factor [Seohaeicola sp. 4SK31]MDD9735715.1 response regulator transcription factor [Seohaeicola sp. SP36]
MGLMNIMLVEDNHDLGEAIERRLRAAGHLVTWNTDGQGVLDEVLLDEPDAIILDLTLPEADGLTILRQLRRNRRDLPVLVITAKAEIDDKVSLLDQGADDYLVKPFDMRELEARLRALTRRPAGHVASRLELGLLELEPAGKVLWLEGRLVDLGLREFRLLETQMGMAGRVVTRERLMSRLFDLEDGGSENALELLVSRVRRKIAGAGVDIVTVRGVGYLARDGRTGENGRDDRV